MSDDRIHELWVAAQLAPNEGIEDAVERMSTICGGVIDWKARAEKAEAKLKWAYDEGYDHGTRLGRKWDEDELKAEAQA